jgi:protein TonB
MKNSKWVGYSLSFIIHASLFAVLSIFVLDFTAPKGEVSYTEMVVNEAKKNVELQEVSIQETVSNEKTSEVPIKRDVPIKTDPVEVAPAPVPVPLVAKQTPRTLPAKTAPKEQAPETIPDTQMPDEPTSPTVKLIPANQIPAKAKNPAPQMTTGQGIDEKNPEDMDISNELAANETAAKLPEAEPDNTEPETVSEAKSQNGDKEDSVSASDDNATLVAKDASGLRGLSTNRPASYPLMARLRKQQGLVVILFNVNQKGEPSNLRVGKSSGFDSLDSEALNTLSKWRFEPGQAGVWKKPFNFSLKGSEDQLPSRLRTQ